MKLCVRQRRDNNKKLYERTHDPKKIYQGIAIIYDPDEGQCITFYGFCEKKDFDLDVRGGKQPDGRKILKSTWLDEPTDSEGIDKIAHELFHLIPQ